MYKLYYCVRLHYVYLKDPYHIPHGHMGGGGGGVHVSEPLLYDGSYMTWEHSSGTA
jgi:hypothetical protein